MISGRKKMWKFESLYFLAHETFETSLDPCLSSHSELQLQVYNVKGDPLKTDLIRILSNV